MAKILIVDDEEEIILSLRVLLEAEGHAVDSTTSAKAALAKIGAEEAPDLVIMDIMMETLTAGVAMARQIRCATSCPHIPVILLSGVNQDFPGLGLSQRDLDSQAAPADRFIEKPYNADDLLRTVRELLAMGRTGNEPLRRQPGPHRNRYNGGKPNDPAGPKQ